MSVLDKFLDAIRLNDDFDDDDEFFDDEDLEALDEEKPKHRFFKKLDDDDDEDDRHGQHESHEGRISTGSGQNILKIVNDLGDIDISFGK